MIALKREVAARNQQVFRGANVKLGNWRQVTVSRIWSTEVETTCVKLMTHTEKCTVTACRTELKCEKEATFFMASQVMRITLKAYDHKLVDSSAKKIIETVNSLSKASLNMEQITQELRQAHLGDMAKNVNKSMLSLEKASGSLARITERVEKGPGTMNSLIYDDALHEDLRALLGGASRNKVIKYFIRESIENSERKKTKTNQ